MNEPTESAIGTLFLPSKLLVEAKQNINNRRNFKRTLDQFNTYINGPNCIEDLYGKITKSVEFYGGLFSDINVRTKSHRLNDVIDSVKACQVFIDEQPPNKLTHLQISGNLLG